MESHPDLGTWRQPRSCVIYLIRHGRTELNAAGVLRGRLDPPLDAVGQAEAVALGELFASVPLAAVVTSPLRRARDTAAVISATSDAGAVVDDALVDRDYGPSTGTPRQVVEQRFGSLDAAPGVEAIDALRARVVTAVLAVAHQCAPGPVAVVAHDAVNRHVLTGLVPALGDPDAIEQHTGCWNVLFGCPDRWAAPVVDAIPGDGQLPDPSRVADWRGKTHGPFR